MHPRRPQWKPPNAGYVKTNFDGAIFEDLHATGIRVVIWDEHGEVIATLAGKIPIPDSVLTLETLAARHTVQFVQKLGLRNSIFEGDSMSSINAISNGQLLHSSCCHIIKDFMLLSSSLQTFSFSHICKQGNALVDAFAKRAKFSFSVVRLDEAYSTRSL